MIVHQIQVNSKTITLAYDEYEGTHTVWIDNVALEEGSHDCQPLDADNNTFV